ncbi:MAG: nitrite oxidoreductase, gamma subunit (modular protein) [Nitrospinae bacterium CG11_big_fil_rev_8_21_14_0_20_45_15]|nr:MAG: nitrite oxidoreductase, gamma subunit (modular protein) [Nitrospinae bacterium CG11_big_fil_rev_8_21_14_0_20_45_15]
MFAKKSYWFVVSLTFFCFTLAPMEAMSAEKNTLGATVYKHMCIYCHGADGNGGGKAVDYLYPWPRDFRTGIYKRRSTPSGSLPLDSDIYNTIAEGISGTGMPAWKDSLTSEEIWGVVQYIKGFSDRFLNDKPALAVQVDPIPQATPESIALGEKIYRETQCSKCHGSDLKGRGELAYDLFDIWDHKVFVYDLTNPNAYKYGFDQKDIYLTLTAGLDGTPMKAYTHLTDEERWNLTHYVHSQIQGDKFEPAGFEISMNVTTVEGEIDFDPENPIWEKIPAHAVHTLPLSARNNPVNRIKVQTAVNDEAIAFRLQWSDPNPDRSSTRHEDFKDAVAIEFALGDAVLHKHGHSEPFFGMGNRAKVVNIWQWRADWQTEIETKKKLEYATDGIDLDVMIFGGEVNPVDSLNPFRDVPVEEMNAEGFGTLTPQPQTKQNILGKGVWKDGIWTVVFYRTLETLNKWDIVFQNERPVLIAFAIWDGSNQDRNGRKVISMWQKLEMPN